MDGDVWHHAECYERTYSNRTLSSQALGQQQPARGVSTTANDHAIAAALAGLSEAQPQPPAANTSMDRELAVQLQEREQDKLLLRAPNAKRLRRRHRALRSLLHHLKPTQLVPRLNPRIDDPSGSYVSEDRARLLLRLDCYGLQERCVKGDGNCQFRALADQLLFDQERHGEVRQAVVDQLCCFPERYRDYVTVDYREYCRSMSNLGTWGDHVSLQAAADAYHVGINIITSFQEECVIGITPVPSEQQEQQPQQVVQQTQALKQEQQAHARGEQEQGMAVLQQAPHKDAPQATSPLMDDGGITLWLAFWAEVHYNSIAPKSADSSAPSDEEGSSSSEDEGERRGKFLGSTKLGRVFKYVM